MRASVGPMGRACLDTKATSTQNTVPDAVSPRGREGCLHSLAPLCKLPQGDPTPQASVPDGARPLYPALSRPGFADLLAARLAT